MLKATRVENEQGKKERQWKGNALVMRLVVLVPLVPGVDPVEVPRLPGAPLVLPIVAHRVRDIFLDVEQLLFLVQLAFGFGAIQGFSEICIAWRLRLLSLLHWLRGSRNESRRSHRTTLGKLSDIGKLVMI